MTGALLRLDLRLLPEIMGLHPTTVIHLIAPLHGSLLHEHEAVFLIEDPSLPEVPMRPCKHYKIPYAQAEFSAGGFSRYILEESEEKP